MSCHAHLPASVAQLDARLTGDQEVDHEIFSLPSADSRLAAINFWRKNVYNTG